MNKVLIITSKEDEHADLIITKINNLGENERIIRINTEDFGVNSTVLFDGDLIKVSLIDSQKTFYTNEISVVWYRRPLPVNTNYDQDDDVNCFVNSQWKMFLEAIYSFTKNSALWINPLDTQLYARNKIYQLKLAKECGFKTPRVIVTNDIQYIANNFQNEIICNKSLTIPRYTVGGTQYAYMTRITDLDFLRKNTDSLSICPTMIQEYIHKESDIRVVVFGENIYAFEIFSQEEEMSKIDYRGITPEKLKHQLIELPKSIVESIRLFINREKLFFSSMDFVKYQDEYYFIENNNNGQWLWLEYITGVNMSDKFVELLLEQ